MNINSHLKVMALLINGAFNFHGKFIPNALSTVIKTNSTAATKKSKMPVHRWAGGGGGGIPLEQPLALYDSFLVAVVKLVVITVLLLLCKPLRNSPLLYQPKMAAKHKTICRDQVL